MFKVNLEAVFANAGATEPVDHDLDLTAECFYGDRSFPEPVKVSGTFRNRAHVVTLNAVIDADLYTVCDRCAKDVVEHLSLPMEHTLVTGLNQEEDVDEYIVIPDMILDLDELVYENLLSDLPAKILCKEDCKGLCPQCGKDLNEGPCDCSKPVDPRLAGLLSFLEDDE